MFNGLSLGEFAFGQTADLRSAILAATDAADVPAINLLAAALGAFEATEDGDTAAITATSATLNPDERLPPLSSDTHVHLTVFTPGTPRPMWNVPQSAGPERRCWHWPERVG